MNILSTNWKSTQWKPNNTLEITLSNNCVIILKDVSFANYLALSSNPKLLDKMILFYCHCNSAYHVSRESLIFQTHSINSHPSVRCG